MANLFFYALVIIYLHNNQFNISQKTDRDLSMLFFGLVFLIDSLFKTTRIRYGPSIVFNFCILCAKI